MTPLSTWHHLDLVVTDYDIEGSRHVMTERQHDAMLAVLPSLPENVPVMSDGMCRVVTETVYLRATLRTRTKQGQNYTVNWANDVRALVEAQKIDHASFDSIAAWLANEAVGSFAGGGGTTSPARELSATGKGGGFSANYLLSDNGAPDRVFTAPNVPVHEWLHQAAWYYPQFWAEFRPMVVIDSPFTYQHAETGVPWTSGNYSAGQLFTGYDFMSAVMRGEVALISAPSDPLGIPAPAWDKPSPRG